tara:strand:+ start:262 stop:423 length:162 start_codon:yes stop_codon:yes gene_type:complete
MGNAMPSIGSEVITVSREFKDIKRIEGKSSAPLCHPDRHRKGGEHRHAKRREK